MNLQHCAKKSQHMNVKSPVYANKQIGKSHTCVNKHNAKLPACKRKLISGKPPVMSWEKL